MNIPNRLKLISDKVGECNKVCDIGTDHAYVPIDLIRKERCLKAIATDIKTGPLLKAKKNIDKFRLKDRIEIRQGNGLAPITPGECGNIIIAGMGGVLISEILQRGFLVAKTAKTLIFQPMYAQEVLRRWLYERGFEIFDETLVAEKEKIYVVMCVRYDGMPKETSEIYYKIGKQLIDRTDPLLPAYLLKLVNIQKKVVSGLSKAKRVSKREFKRQEKILKGMETLLISVGKENLHG